MSFLSRHGVVAAASPWVAAQQPPDSQCKPLEGAMLDDGLTGILRACGRETAGGWGEGRDAPLVEEDGQDQHPAHGTEQSSEDILVPRSAGRGVAHSFSETRLSSFCTRSVTSAVGNRRSVCHTKASSSDFPSGRASQTIGLLRR